MTSTTLNYGFRIPDESDPPDGATQVDNLGNDIDAQLKITDDTVATNAEHDTLIATLLGGATTEETQTSDNASLTTEPAYVTMTVASVPVGHSFIAPPSGKVVLEWGASVNNSVASGSTIFVGTEVADGAVVGSGTVVSAVADTQSTQDNGTNDRESTKSRTVTGLTPGDTYNVYMRWRQSGATTSTAHNPFVRSIPQLA